MKIAIMTDLHANLPALNAALDAMRRENCDAIYHCGDAIGIGPHPAECLDLLLNTPNIRFVMGNHDASFVCGIPAGISAGEADHHRWTHSQLSPSHRAAMATWPYIDSQVLDGVETTFVHYALKPCREDFLPIIPSPTLRDLEKLFAGISGSLLFYGHHPAPTDLSASVRYINPGSLGCCPDPIAHYCVLECQAGTYRLSHRAIPYHDGSLFEDFETRQVPDRHVIYKAFFGGRFKPQ